MIEVVQISEVVVEGKGITTLRFKHQGRARSGQFIMVWIPGMDEVPMSLSYIEGDWGITIRDVGEATHQLSSMKVGDKLGMRGPYGRGFQVPEGPILIVGGGGGTAALMPIADSISDPERVDIAIGARTVAELIFEERARSLAKEVRIATDDGT